MDAGLIQRLETAGLQELRAEWGQRFGAAPRLRSADLLRRTLAWRIQVAKEGGLDRAIRRLLAGSSAGAEALMAEGTVITREWKGARTRHRGDCVGAVANVERAPGAWLVRPPADAQTCRNPS